MQPDLSRLCKTIGYNFSDMGLLEQALTHRSANRKENNERLEFLGDAQLSQIISIRLYSMFAEASEGQLTRMRASLVKGQTLAVIAKEMSIGDYLSLGGGELKSGGFRRESILADALEAIIGAVLLDGSEVACQKMVLSWYAQRLDTISPTSVLKDPKTQLQEWLQGRQRPLPLYEVVEITGQAPKQEFKVSCALTDADKSFTAQGSSRRRAEQRAAAAALAELEEKK
ncbi:MAG: ribonuclease III [Alcanivoracaceae bacterium]|nr:ribonuclease III [Alcanivoracaceae bacterium]